MLLYLDKKELEALRDCLTSKDWLDYMFYRESKAGKRILKKVEELIKIS